MGTFATFLPFALVGLAILIFAGAFLPSDRGRTIARAALSAGILVVTALVGLLALSDTDPWLAGLAAAFVFSLLAVLLLLTLGVPLPLGGRGAAERSIEPASASVQVAAGHAGRARDGTPPVIADPAIGAEDILRSIDIAASRARVTFFAQDGALRYRWLVNPRLGWGAADVIGRSDRELLPPDVLAAVEGPKRLALESGEPQVFHLDLEEDGERVHFLIDVIPVETDDGTRELVGLADDVTQQRQLEAARADLGRQLAQTLRQLRLALRSGRISVTSQDRNLVYRWANGAFGGLPDASVIGRTDEDILSPEDRRAVIDLKCEAIASGAPRTAEIGIGTGNERRWFDLHVEPDVDASGEVVGVTSAAIDVTHRRRNEEQMRQVLRELTHRTKNLLAVTIAIARQTARNAGSVKDYSDALIGRLRALSAAQDLIVADNWGGVDLAELVWLQLAQSQGPDTGHFEVDGPRVILTPEVSQNLGLAMHELASNALRHGAFSVPGGRVRVDWSVERGDGDGRAGDVLALKWREIDGPMVVEPSHRGFGMNVLERTLRRSLDADVDVAFEPQGLVAAFRIPCAQGISLEDG